MAEKDYDSRTSENYCTDKPNSNRSPDKEYTSPRKKYGVGSDVDKELVFDFPFILDEDTVAYIKECCKVMFLIRGPPSTGKATLSEMLCEKYPKAAHCCADHFFQNSFISPMRTRDSLKASHRYCAKKAETACLSDLPTIIVQNTHMRKWEMQSYLDLAATYNYTVIMAITLYRFDVTPQALLENSPDGLNISYFKKRLQQWEDIPPVLTGWFLSRNDSSYLQNLMLKSKEELMGDGKSCRIFNIDTDEAINYQAKKLLYCLAGYTADSYQMKEHYLKPVVQDSYGKCFTITILGFHFTPYNICALVKVTKEMNPLLFSSVSSKRSIHFSQCFSSLQVCDNMPEYNRTMPYKVEQDDAVPKKLTVETVEWEENENINVFNCSFIHLAQKDNLKYNVEKLQNELLHSLRSRADDKGEINNSAYLELESKTWICQLGDDQLFVKAPNKVSVKAIFTGLYN